MQNVLLLFFHLSVADERKMFKM